MTLARVFPSLRMAVAGLLAVAGLGVAAGSAAASLPATANFPASATSGASAAGVAAPASAASGAGATTAVAPAAPASAAPPMTAMAPVAAARATASAGAARAVPASGGPAWSELTDSQRKVLAPLAGDWKRIDARSKERWLLVAAGFPRMAPAQQQLATQRMVVWSHMTPMQRTQARLNFEEARNVSREEREARWKAYQALPEAQKRALAARRAAAVASSASNAAGNRRHAATPVDAVQPKNNLIASVPAHRTPLEPGSTVLRTSNGATTTLLSRHPSPPVHQPAGKPKIAAGPADVDRTTLLPRAVPPAPGGSSTVAASSPARP